MRGLRTSNERLFSVVVSAALCVAVALATPAAVAQQKAAARPQKIDEAYTAKIKEYTQDPRILTELVDHLPASATVPTPLTRLLHPSKVR